MIKNAKINVPWTHVNSNLKGQEIAGTFYENKLQRKEFRIEKVIKRKGYK